MCYMSLCCRRFYTNVGPLIDACMKTNTGYPDIEQFEALGLRHVEEVIAVFMHHYRYL
jgi:hypothetical protein